MVCAAPALTLAAVLGNIVGAAVWNAHVTTLSDCAEVTPDADAVIEDDEP